jgi:hypothetical protein
MPHLRALPDLREQFLYIPDFLGENLLEVSQGVLKRTRNVAVTATFDGRH